MKVDQNTASSQFEIKEADIVVSDKRDPRKLHQSISTSLSPSVSDGDLSRSPFKLRAKPKFALMKSLVSLGSFSSLAKGVLKGEGDWANRSGSIDSFKSIVSSEIVEDEDQHLSTIAKADDFRHFSLAGLYTMVEVKVTIRWQECSANFKVYPTTEVSVVIIEVAKIFNISISGNTGLLLGKDDRQNPGMRVWFNPDLPISIYSLQQGDELVLKHGSNFEALKITILPSNELVTIEYNHESLVSDTISKLKTKLNCDGQFGLYNHRLGMWLDGSKTLFVYDLHEQVIQFRALANEFLLRISLLEYNQKIGIKVLPTFTVSDVLSIIKFQMHNRKLTSSNQDHHGLFIPSLSQWMDENVSISEFPAIRSETLVFKLQNELCSLMFQNRKITVLVDSNAIVQDVLSLLMISSSLSLDQEYAIYSTSGDELIPFSNMSQHLKDTESREIFHLKMKPLAVLLTCNLYPGYSCAFNLDKSNTLSFYISSFCRRFGFRKINFSKMTTESSGLRLDVDIFRCKFTNPKLEVHFLPHIEFTPLELVDLELKDHSIKAFTLDQLVDQIAQHNSQMYADGNIEYLDFIKTFLLTYQSFTTLQVLLDKLFERYQVINTKNQSWAEFELSRKPIQLKIGNFVLQWVKKFPFDLIIPDIGKSNIRLVLEFVDKAILSNHTILAKQIRKILTKLQSTRPAAPPKAIREDSPETNAFIFSLSAEEIAEQLTILESRAFCAILPPELLNLAWSKQDAVKKAPSIILLSRAFNALATWVAQSIIECKTPKLRGERMNKIIEIANHLLYLNNYSSLMSIIAGTNKACVSRLKASIREMSQKSIKRKSELETLMSALGSYKNYRASIHSIAPPCIPYIGTYLTDLTYIEDGNPDLFEDRINFSKRDMIGKVIKEIMDYQQCPYTLKPIHLLLEKFNNFPESSETIEKKLWKMSKELE